jgi:hypothetical protein
VERARSTHDLVVVTVPPLTRSVAALDIALRADAALLVDDLGTARRNDAAKVIAEIRATGCPLVGCVLVGLGNARIGTAGTVAPVVTAAPDASARTTPSSAARPNRPLRTPGALVDWTENQPAALSHDHVNGSM